MDVVRRIGRLSLAAGILALGAGLGIAAMSALVAGDWWLAREPAIGYGLALIVAGLAITAVAGTVLVVVEPIGLWRALALPPVVLVGLSWADLLLIGLHSHAGAERDVAIVLYSLPELLAAAVVLTLLIPLPIALARVTRHAPTVTPA